MILILIGKSASGKDTILKRYLDDGFLHKIISYTTRPKRIGEVNGIDYNFVSDNQFDEMERQGKFFQTRTYNTFDGDKPCVWKYGSDRVSNKNIHYGAIMDVQGARDYIKEYGKENVFVVYVDAPKDLRKTRYMSRSGGEGFSEEKEWSRRAADDDIKFSDNNIKDIVDLRVDNSGSDIRDVIFNISYSFYDYIMRKKPNKISERIIKK